MEEAEVMGFAGLLISRLKSRRPLTSRSELVIEDLREPGAEVAVRVE